jgi:LacI family transcriptional regulator, galactose operon repressor
MANVGGRERDSGMKPARHPKRHITIRDVARAAGASVSTVSAALNNTDYVSAEMRERIEKAIRRLRYRPNDLARSLRLHRTHTIAIVVPDLLNSFYTEVVRGMKDYAGTANYTLLVGDSRERWDEERTYLDELHRRRVDGIVRIPAIDDLGGQAEHVMGDIPVVYADRFPHSKDRNVGCVGVDNIVSALDATRYLLSLGHRRIAIVAGQQESKNSAERLEGYRRAMRSARVPVDRNLVRIGDNGILSGHREAMELLTRADRPTAIFCTNNMMALGALQAVQELKLRCPKDVSLLGFDDFYWATLLRPRLTMVRQPAREIGMTAARMLIEYIEGRPQQPSVLRLPTQLMVRDSCAPPSDNGNS